MDTLVRNARNHLLKLLSKTPKTIGESREYLRKKGLSDVLIEPIIEEFKQN